MKFFCTILIFSIVFGLLSCSSDPVSSSHFDSVQSDTLSAQQTASIEPFEPDAYWTTPTETVSQYGPSGIIRDVVIDENGIIWMAAWDGIVSYNLETEQFTNQTLKNGLSHHRVYCVMQDSKGNMWFGTMGAGAYKYDGARFTNYSTNIGMIHNVVFDLHEDKKGNIWFATTQGVSMYDGRSFTSLDSSNGLTQAVYAISQDDSETMWFGGEGGLFQCNTTKGYWNVTEVMTAQETHYANVRDLYWNGLSMYIGCSSGFYCTQIDNPDQIASISQNFTSYIHGSNNGDLILTADGIYRYAPPSPNPHVSPSLPWTTIIADKSNLGIFGAREDKDGTIWYGAMDGLHSVKDGKDVSYKQP